jgi:hypothetical protein
MSGTIPKWLERFLGIDTAGSGEGTVWSLKYTWSLAPWLGLVLALAAVAFVTYCYVQEAGSATRRYRLSLAGMRLLLIAMIAFMLAQVMLSLERTGLPYVAVVLDDSGSMGVEDRYDDETLRMLLSRELHEAGLSGTTRLNLAKSVLLAEDSRLLRHIDRRYKLRFYLLADSARQQPSDVDELVEQIRRIKPTGDNTRLGQGIRTILNDLRGTPPTAIVVLSDGITTEGESLSDAATYARRKGVPLFTVALGSESPTRDLELSDLQVDDVVFVDDVVNFKARLASTGFEGRRLEVTLREKSTPAPLAKIEVTAGPDGKPQDINLPYRPTKVGEFEYVVEVQHLPEEVDADNNRQQRIVSVRKEQIHVLLVQSYPNFEFRYLKQMLGRDSTVVLKTVLQESDLEYSEIDKTALRVFPVRKEDLFENDVIIFGDVNPAFLSASAMQNIDAFVRQKGGGLVFVAGPLYTPSSYRDTPLARLMPIDAARAVVPSPTEVLGEGYQVHPTDLGEAMPALQLGDTSSDNQEIWRKLPPLYWLLETPALKPGARVLAERVASDGRTSPVITAQYVDLGKVLFHATDETWRWRYRVGDVFFARYWVQTLRYLSRSKLLGKDRSAELSVDRREYRRGESVRLRVRFLDERAAPAEDDGVTIVMEQEGHQNRRIKLHRNALNRGVFEGVMLKPSDGKYHAWIAAPSLQGTAAPADFRVVAPPGEFERLQMDSAEMKRASEQTKGHFYTFATALTLADDLPKGHQVPIEALPSVPLWNQWPLLLTFLIVLVGEWVLRKRKGML